MVSQLSVNDRSFVYAHAWRAGKPEDLSNEAHPSIGMFRPRRNLATSVDPRLLLSRESRSHEIGLLTAAARYCVGHVARERGSGSTGGRERRCLLGHARRIR